MRFSSFPRLGSAVEGSFYELLEAGKEVKVEDWQALDVSNAPQGDTIEILNFSVVGSIPKTPAELQDQIEPSLPWAEEQFQERVSGEPLNPGETYLQWPWYAGKGGEGVEEHKQGGQFSHTYMERYWPKLAGPDIPRTGHPGYGFFEQRGKTPVQINGGIRYPYGDLNDLVAQLARSPHTRQAYLPIFFPEDTGAVHGERVPCTLGYHFILREDKLHCVYYIRSCDAVRHFRNDVYMTCRLVQWVLEELKDEDTKYWEEITPGTLTMHITSFHCFKGDLPKLRREYA